MREIFARLDPRTRLLTVVVATLIVASTPKGHLTPFAYFLPISIALILTSRASGLRLILRCMAASPFILLASGLLAFESGITPDGRPAGVAAALSVALKGYMAALLLALLTATTPLPDLLWSLRKFRAPESLNLILGMMYRYTHLLSEEHARLERARHSRTVRPLGRRRYGLYGRQLATLLLRSWDRADRIHAAMLSRGFNGDWPAMTARQMQPYDLAFLACSTGLFLSARLMP